MKTTHHPRPQTPDLIPTISPVASAVQPLCNGELQLGFTGLLDAFRNRWFQCGMSANEVQFYIGVSAREFLKVGWLREELRSPGHLFWPAGALKENLERDVEEGISNELDHRSHLSPLPSDLSQSPASPETIPVRQIESGASQSSKPTAGAAAVSELRGEKGEVRGRRDAASQLPNSQLSGLTKDLADMVGALKEHSDVLIEHLTQITADQELKGWPDLTRIEDANASLFRLTSDLHNHIRTYQTTLKWAARSRRKLSA